ncbi:MAG: hypothetical protein AAB475_02235 [Patescibacteria group bacterium]
MSKKILRKLKTRLRDLLKPQGHILKEITVKKYKKHFKVKTFIETGTYLGEMVDAVKDSFDKIYSIELNEELYKKAKNNFARFSNIEIMHGDSGEILPELLNNINEPILFWLDGHYSAGNTSKGSLNTPIIKELVTIFQHPIKQHIILIDDARLFNGADDYPTSVEVSTIAEKYGYKQEIKKDIIIISHP